MPASRWYLSLFLSGLDRSNTYLYDLRLSSKEGFSQPDHLCDWEPARRWYLLHIFKLASKFLATFFYKTPCKMAILPIDQLDDLFGLGKINDQGREVSSKLQSPRQTQKKLPVASTKPSIPSSPDTVVKFKEAKKFYDAGKGTMWSVKDGGLMDIKQRGYRSHKKTLYDLLKAVGNVVYFVSFDMDMEDVDQLLPTDDITTFLSCELVPQQEICKQIENIVTAHRNRMQNQCQKEGCTSVEKKLRKNGLWPSSTSTRGEREGVWKKELDWGARQMFSKLATGVEIVGLRAGDKMSIGRSIYLLLDGDEVCWGSGYGTDR
ncbi:uncharacterized protein PAC_10504 [Phialocephala subalpina]|uniref:Uncharacterized protein n=1 Tax=Phialocephala subalpina TaxID=576137 RepID=A0A1L7X6H1_9HELO|nr:uncharacterized protein PAC_10504 [Phialocephala subalpina]